MFIFPIESTGATNIVYGEGNPDAALILIGEAPGKQEDELGRPLVGSLSGIIQLNY